MQNAIKEMQAAKIRWDAAKTKKAMREAREDYKFWSNKAAMLEVISRKLAK